MVSTLGWILRDSGSIHDFPHLDAGLFEMGTDGDVAVTCGTKGRHG